MEKVYRTSEVCKWFDIPRTTLFRWEEDARIPQTERTGKNQRIYRQEHLERISEIVLEIMRVEQENCANQDNLCSTLETMERRYRLEYFSRRDEQHSLRQLEGLALKGELSQKTIQYLIEDALSRDDGDPVRVKIWEILKTYDEHHSRN